MNEGEGASSVAVYVRASDIDEQPFEEELLLFQRQLRTVVSLNRPGACLWQSLAWPQSQADLAALLVEAGLADPGATDTASAWLGVLVEQGFVVTADSVSPSHPG